MQQSTYGEIRDQIRQGDIIAFGGHGFVSDAIKWFTKSPVSHVGIVLDTKLALDGAAQDGRIVQLIESTTLNGKSGVQINRLSERVAGYAGVVWWLPLSDQIRSRCDWKRFFDYALHQVGKDYDYHQVAGMILRPLSHIPWLGRLFTNPRNAGKVYCSELACKALQMAGGIDMDVNYSNISPQDLAQMNMYDSVMQIKGKPTEIPKVNIRSV